MAQIVYESRDKSSQHLSAAPCTFSSDLSLVILPKYLGVLVEKSGIFLLSNFIWKVHWNLGRFAVKEGSK